MHTINLLFFNPLYNMFSIFSVEKTQTNHSDAPPQNLICYYKNGQQVNEIPNLKELFFKNCFKIYNIFPEKMLRDIERLSREMKRHFGNDSSDMLVKLTNESIEFSSSHEILDPGSTLKKFQEKSPLLEKILSIFITRFAIEQQWVGTHKFDLQLFRYTPLSGKNTTQKWHYDTGSKKTMIMVITNDFEHYDGIGINISKNNLEGSFNPLEHFEEQDINPKDNEHISTNYPYNGAVIFDGQNGALVHQMSPLTAQKFDQPKSRIRTILQIKDKAWKST